MRVDDVLSGRDGAGGVRTALQSSPMRRSVRHSVSNVLGPVPLGPCHLRRTKFKPNHKLTAWFDATAGSAARSPRVITVTWWAGDGEQLARTDEEAALEAEAEQRGLCAPFLRLTTSVPGMRMRILISPLDAAFPQLVRFSDPAYVSALMSDSPSVVAVRYRPGQRHVLRYQPARGGGPTVFAKLYRDDTGARAHRVTNAMAELFADQAGDNAVARPSAYLGGEDRALLVPLVAGVPLSAQLRSNASGTGPHLRNAGAILRQLHDAPDDIARLVDGHDLEAELGATARASGTIRQLMPSTGRFVHDVLARTRDMLRGLPAERPCFSHGDYKADHLLVGRKGLTLIDFDRAARRDPALDLAKFLADLRWWSGIRSSSSAESAQAQFIRGYGPISRGRLTRARLLEPLFLVKLAARRVPLHEPAWEQRTSTRVEQAAQLLHDRAREVHA